MSIKNPEQDLYEAIQFVREGKKEVDEERSKEQQAAGKAAMQKRGMSADSKPKETSVEKHKRLSSARTDAKQSEAGVKKQRLPFNKGGTGDLGYRDPKTSSRNLRRQQVTNLKSRRAAAAKRTESFDDDDNAIIEEIKNRVLAVLGERVAGQEGEGQSGSGERRRANIPTTADSKFLELRKKRQKQTRQAPSE